MSLTTRNKMTEGSPGSSVEYHAVPAAIVLLSGFLMPVMATSLFNGGAIPDLTHAETFLLVTFSVCHGSWFLGRGIYMWRCKGFLSSTHWTSPALRPERILLAGYLYFVAIHFAFGEEPMTGNVALNVAKWFGLFLLTAPILDAAIASPHEVRNAVRQFKSAETADPALEP